MSAQGYSAEEHAAAWAAYYAQQGYTQTQIAAALGTSAGASSAAGPSSYEYDYASSSAPTTGPYPAAPAHVQKQIAESEMFAQSAVYNPDVAADLAKSGFVSELGGEAGGSGSGGGAKRPVNVVGQGKRETVVRKGNGRTWEDPTLLEWDPKWYRLFVGDVSNDVNERTLDEAFGVYPSYCKSKVVRDRLSLKAKYGFIAFKDPEDFLKAWKEMDGKYVGNRPIKLSKIKDDKYGSIATTTVSGRKARELDKLRKNKGKPLNGRPTPW